MSDIDGMNVGPRWYVAHTYSGYESKVKANLEKIVENRGLGDKIFDIRIPVETIVEKNGKSRGRSQNHRRARGCNRGDTQKGEKILLESCS